MLILRIVKVNFPDDVSRIALINHVEQSYLWVSPNMLDDMFKTKATFKVISYGTEMSSDKFESQFAKFTRGN